MSRRHVRTIVGAAMAIAVALTGGCNSPGPASPPSSPFPEGTPKLVLFLVVDQMSQEYLDRLRPLLSGGLDYLLEQGAVFADAHHNHANTVTGAGHATLSTGCYPRRSGIIGNQWYDRETRRDVYCVQGQEFRRSPANLQVSTLGDWLKGMDPESKVFAAGGKDRSAILTAGHDADGALWYSGGDWVSSGYYDEPEWLEAFNDRKLLDAYFGTMWEPLPVPEYLLEQAAIVQMDEGIYEREFPYAFGSKSLAPNGSFYSALLSSPFSDAYLAELAKTIIEEERLGSDQHPDFLGLAFHALDYVGHNFGPHSREVVDTILRLDQTLAELLAFIDQRIGLDNVVISLSADHGVAPLPAYRNLTGTWGERADVDDIACYQTVGRTLRERHGDYEWLLEGLYLNDDAIAAEALDRDALETEIASLLGECEFVRHVWTRRELLEPPADDDYFHRLYYNSYHPERSPDFQVQYEPYYLDKLSRGSSHGTPYEYDTWVPLVVVAPGLVPSEIGTRVHTADLAPTLAAIMGIVAAPDLDGTDLTPLLSWR